MSLLITSEEIQERVNELGKVISQKFDSKNPIFIGVLNGSFMFMSDLCKNINISNIFIKISVR